MSNQNVCHVGQIIKNKNIKCKPSTASKKKERNKYNNWKIDYNW